MGVHASLVCIEGLPIDELLEGLGDKLTGTNQTVPGYTAISSVSSPGLCVARSGNWTFPSDPRAEYIFDSDVLEELSQGRRVLAFFLSGVTTSYGFFVYENAKLIRKVVYEDFRCAEEVGEPLRFEAAFEPTARGYEEAEIFGTLEAITGLTFIPDLEKLTFELLHRTSI
jgi:hypothetical protein